MRGDGTQRRQRRRYGSRCHGGHSIRDSITHFTSEGSVCGGEGYFSGRCCVVACRVHQESRGLGCIYMLLPPCNHSFSWSTCWATELSSLNGLVSSRPTLCGPSTLSTMLVLSSQTLVDKPHPCTGTRTANLSRLLATADFAGRRG